MKTFGIVVAVLVLFVVSLGATAYQSFQWGREFEQVTGRHVGKPCECKRCRCMSQGVPGNAAGAEVAP